jgi:tetratricopeptide (TPR) repeat protein
MPADRAAFSPAGDRVVTVGDGARVWDAKTGDQLTPRFTSKETPFTLSWGPEGQLLIPDLPGVMPFTPIFSPDGQLLVTQVPDGLRVWDAATGEPLTPTLAYPGRFDAGPILFSDGNRLQIGSQVWDLSPEGRPVEELVLLSEVLSGNRIDATGGLAEAPERFETAWRDLRTRYPHSMVLAAEPVLAWHRSEAQAGAAAGLWASALAHLDALVAAEPTQWALHAWRGSVCAELGRLDEAAAEYQEAGRLRPDAAVPLRYQLAKLLALRGRLEQALAVCKEALRERPDDALPVFGLVRALWDGGRYNDAFAALKAILKWNETTRPKVANAGALLDLGQLFLVKGPLDAAIAACQEAVRLRPDLQLAYYYLGEALARKGQWDDAIRARTEAVRLSPPQSLPARLCNLGLALGMKGRWEEATAAYRRAVKGDDHGDKRFARVHNDAAWFLATCPDPRFRDPGEAVRLAKRAVELDPGEGTLWNTLGAASYRAGEWQGAVDALNRSMDLRKGGDGWDWLFLAMAQWRLGNREQARKRYDQAVQWAEQNQPENEDVRRLRAEAAAVLGIDSKESRPKDTKKIP